MCPLTIWNAEVESEHLELPFHPHESGYEVERRLHTSCFDANVHAPAAGQRFHGFLDVVTRWVEGVGCPEPACEVEHLIPLVYRDDEARSPRPEHLEHDEPHKAAPDETDAVAKLGIGLAYAVDRTGNRLAQRVLEGDVVPKWNDPAGRHDDVLGVPFSLGVHRHAVAFRDLIDPFSHRIDDAGYLVPDEARILEGLHLACPHLDFAGADPTYRGADADLAVARLGDGSIFYLKPAGCNENACLHNDQYLKTVRLKN